MCLFIYDKIGDEKKKNMHSVAMFLNSTVALELAHHMYLYTI